jgi:hypothetical protein
VNTINVCFALTDNCWMRRKKWHDQAIANAMTAVTQAMALANAALQGKYN